VSRSLYAMTGRVTSVTVSLIGGGNPGTLTIRTTAVFIQDTAIPLAPIQISDDIGGASVLLDRCALRVASGAYIAVNGERTDRAGRVSVEIAHVTQATLEDGFTRLTFDQDLDGTYKIDSVFFNSNVVAATNGETVSEILGSGDASTAFQTFPLKQMPL